MKETRGGNREGAGRPPVAVENKMVLLGEVKLFPDTKKSLDKKLKKLKEKKSAYVRRLIENDVGE